MKPLKVIGYIFLLVVISLIAAYNVLYLLSLEEPETYSVIANINHDGELKDISFNNLTKTSDRKAFIVRNVNDYPVSLKYTEKGEVFDFISVEKIDSLNANEERQTYMNIEIKDLNDFEGLVLRGNLTIHGIKPLFWFLY